MSLIAHVDMDSFYVSVERERDPSLIGKPVVVGGNSRRGVVASASYEARRFGVKSAMPMGEALDKCPGLIVVEPHGALYTKRSREIFEILERLSPVVEPVSIDEAYLDMAGTEKLYGNPEKTARHIREEILKETGLSASVGIASVRHLAKMASKRAKPAGIFWVQAGTERDFLAPLPVRDMPGIGPSLEQKLSVRGIFTLGDLAARDPGEMERSIGSHAASFVLRARGEGEEILSVEDVVKSIGKEVTFERDTKDLSKLEPVLLGLCEKVASRLRRRGLWGRTVTVKLRDSRFHTWGRAHTLSQGTQDDAVIYETAVRILREELSEKPRPLRLIGVTASHLEESAPAVQEDLFAPSRERKRQLSAGGRRAAAVPKTQALPEKSRPATPRLEEAVDKIRERFGFEAVRRASALDTEEGQQSVLTGKGALRSELPSGFRGALRDEEDED